MQKENILAIMPWNKCNAACRHCAINSSIDSADKIGCDKLFSIVDQAKAYFDGEWCLAISGGEPFLYWNDLVDLVRYVNQNNGYSTIMTNCSWAKNYIYAKEKLTLLKDNGLRSLGLSCDEFHLEWISIDNIRNVVKSCQELHIRTTIKCIPTDNIKLSDIVNLIEDIDPWYTNFTQIPVTLSGRAELIKYSKKYKYDKFAGMNCVHQHMIITANGDVQGCCNGGGENMIIGNIYRNNLSDLFYLFYTDQVLQFIKINNFDFCVKYLNLNISGNEYTDICDICNSIFNKKLNYDKIKDYVNGKLNNSVTLIETIDQ